MLCQTIFNNSNIIIQYKGKITFTNDINNYFIKLIFHF
ncbi:hypothetical protein VRK_36370 [Vibrio sp. MEBiC08052]|nr:hypothetical protein VRK_36370 [Vibrio sp. MEBiC08052]